MQGLKYLFFGATLFFLVNACNSGNGNKETGEDGTVVKMEVDVSPQTATQMQEFLEAYYRVADALVQDDSTGAMEAANGFLEKANTISLETLPDDDRKEEAQEKITHLKDEIADFQDETALEDLRSDFEDISEQTYHLIKIVGLKDVTVYRTYCPMAFDDQGAYWLSNSSDILNPYFGHKMINCGEVSETLEF